jgi:hypothetical protein
MDARTSVDYVAPLESREAFDRFREEKLLPALREVAGETPPPAAPEISPVHKLIAG